MADRAVLAATLRTKTGKGGARATRREGRIPAIVYGDSKAPVTISVESRELVRQLNTGGFFNTVFDLQIDGNSNQVLPRDVQLHPVTDVPEHVDFMRVGGSAAITVEVPVEFLNDEDCPGLRAGGVLNIVRYAVEVSCRADLIPAAIQVDLATAELGDSLHISAVSLPEGVTPTITDRDFTIATIAVPSAVASELAEEDEEQEEEEEELEE